MYDNLLARNLRDAAIDKVEAHAHVPWLADAWSSLKGYCLMKGRGHRFTVPGFAMEVRLADAAEPRALGALMRRAVKERLLVGTELYWQSPSPKQHLRPAKVWEVA